MRLLYWLFVAMPLLAGCGLNATTAGALRPNDAQEVIFTAHAGRPVVDLTDREFKIAMVRLAADVHAPSLRSANRLVLAAWEPEDDRFVRDYQAWCSRCHEPADCLSLLGNNGSILDDGAKRILALAIAMGSVSEGLIDGFREEFLSAVATSIGAYLALLVMPEPASKVLAGGLTVMLWAYLGSELWNVARGYLQLVDEVDAATSFVEVREAGERFGRTIGVRTARILIMVAAAELGSGGLAANAPGLPGYVQATELAGLSEGSYSLAGIAGGARTVAISQGNLSVVLASGSVVAMVANPGAPEGAGSPPEPKPRGYSSFKSFKRATGPAGQGQHWHHVVEQTPGNVARFGTKTIQSIDNMVSLDAGVHGKVSSLYSSIRFYITGSRTLTVRAWLSTQSLEAQRAFGLLAIENIGKGIW